MPKTTQGQRNAKDRLSQEVPFSRLLRLLSELRGAWGAFMVIAICALSAVAPVQAQTHSVTISFTPSVSAGVTGYNAYRGPISGGPYTAVGSTAASPFKDLTVVAGTTDFYVLTAVAGGVESPYSAEVKTVIPGAVPPPPPTADITLTASPTSLAFTGTVGGANPACQKWSGDDSGVGPLPVALTGPAWVQISSPTSTTKFTANICPIITGLTASQSGTLQFVNTAPNASNHTAKNSPLSVPISITLAAPPPPAMSIACPAASAGVTNLPTGAYSMSVTSGKATASCTGTK